MKIYLHQSKIIGRECIHLYNVKASNRSHTLILEKFPRNNVKESFATHFRGVTILPIIISFERYLITPTQEHCGKSIVEVKI